MSSYINKTTYTEKDSRFICRSCESRKSILSQSSSTTVSTVSSSEDPSYVIQEKMEEELEFVELGFPRNISTHKYCCLCGSLSNITIVPFEARKQVISKRRLFIPQGNRCCKNHIIKSMIIL